MSAHESLSQEIPATGMEKFLDDNFRKLVWLFVVMVFAIFAYGLIHYQSSLKSNEAAEAFTAVKTVEDCDLVISRFSGTNAAANALLKKADMLWDQNKKSSAIEVLKEFTAKHASHPLAVPALLGLGSKLDSMGDRKEAQAIFERITREFPSSEAAPLAQVRLGDLLWAEGKADEAKKAYEDVAAKFPDMPAFQTASNERLNWIAASLPTKEVDPPPAPKVEPKPAGEAAVPKINLNAAPGGIAPSISLPGAPAPAATTPPATPKPTPASIPTPQATPPAAPAPLTPPPLTPPPAVPVTPTPKPEAAVPTTPTPASPEAPKP